LQAGEIFNLIAKSSWAHAIMTELTPQELVAEVKAVHDILASEKEVEVPELQPSGPAHRSLEKPCRFPLQPGGFKKEEGLLLRGADYLEFMEGMNRESYSIHVQVTY